MLVVDRKAELMKLLVAPESSMAKVLKDLLSNERVIGRQRCSFGSDGVLEDSDSETVDGKHDGAGLDFPCSGPKAGDWIRLGAKHFLTGRCRQCWRYWH